MTHNGHRITFVYTTLLLFLSSLPILALQQADTPDKTQSATVPSNATSSSASVSALKSDKEKQSYALGMTVANQLRSLGLDVDKDVFVKGLQSDAGGDKALLSNGEATAIVKQIRAERKRALIARQKAVAYQQMSRTDPAPIKLKVSFKIDPRLSGGTYGGEVWVAPPVFSSAGQAGKQATIEAKAQGSDAQGTQTVLAADWLPSDAEAVTVTPGEKNEVKITVHKPGLSKMTVSSHGVSTELTIVAKDLGKATQVEVTQK